MSSNHSKIKFHLPFFLFLTFALFGCKSNQEKLDTLEADVSSVAIIGDETYGEGLIDVFTNKNDTNNVCRHLPLEKSVTGYESIFNYIVINSKEEHAMAKSNRIVVLFDEISNDLESDISNDPIKTGELIFQKTKIGTYKVFKDVWAIGQCAIKIELNENLIESIKNSKNTDAITKANLIQISSGIQQIVLDCHQLLQLKGSIGYYNANSPELKYTDSIMKLLGSNYGFNFFVPNAFRIVQADSTFVWLLNIKSAGGYEAIMVNINQTPVDISNLRSLIENRNLFTSKYLHNDEGTKIVVSESGAYNPFIGKPGLANKQPYNVFYGWFTELGTYRRGPFGRYIFNNGKKQVAIDWFAGGAERYNSIKSHLDLIAQSFKFTK
jgi:hypothetical protein